MRDRLYILDLLRGVAILLMVLDHTAVAFDLAWPLRMVGRIAMPLFMVISGYLYRGFNAKRYFTVAAVAIVSALLEIGIGLPQPGILVSWCLSVLFMPLVVRNPPVSVFLGLCLYLTVSVTSGYHPGLIVAFLALGRLVNFKEWAVKPTLMRAVAFLGRYPLTMYVGHLVLLIFLSEGR